MSPTWMILIEWDNLAEGMISSVCQPIMSYTALDLTLLDMSYTALWTAEECEWQGIHDNYKKKWVCAQYSKSPVSLKETNVYVKWDK